MEVKPGYERTEVGVIPDDWEVRLLPDVCRFRSGKAHEQHISETGRFVCVNSKFISTDGSVRKLCSANFCAAKQGDILMVMSDLPNGRALAKAYLTEQNALYAVNQRVCALTPYRDSPQYLFYVLNRNPYFLKFDDGVNQTHLLNPVFQKCPLPLPPSRAEQEAIAGALGDMDALLGALEKLIAKKRDLKQAAMQQLLTGQTRLPGFHGEWEVKRVVDLGEVVTGGTPRTDVAEYWGDGYPWITPTDISSHRDMFSSERTLTQKGLNAIRALRANTVLVTCIASIGKNAILKIAGACNQQINAVTPNENNSAEFLYYAFETSKQFLLANAGTTATSIISKSAFAQLTFTVPPSPNKPLSPRCCRTWTRN